MTDREIEKVLNEGPVAAVLVERGGWMTAALMTIDAKFLGEPILWEINRYTVDGIATSSFYTTADRIIGISIRRHHEQEPEGPPAESRAEPA